MSDYVYVARDMVIKILSNHEEPTADALYDLFEIQSGSKKVLLEHLKAIHKIFGKAIDELEVIEEDKKIEKLVGEDKGHYIDYSVCNIVGKINEIIDYLMENKQRR